MIEELVALQVATYASASSCKVFQLYTLAKSGLGMVAVGPAPAVTTSCIEPESHAPRKLHRVSAILYTPGVNVALGMVSVVAPLSMLGSAVLIQFCGLMAIDLFALDIDSAYTAGDPIEYSGIHGLIQPP